MKRVVFAFIASFSLWVAIVELAVRYAEKHPELEVRL